MRAPADTQSLDFTLQKMIFAADIGAKVQAGDTRLVVVPFQYQPRISRAELAELGLCEADGQTLVDAVRLAYSMGIIAADIAPIRPGCAFELLQPSPSHKLVRFGTGIVRRMAITRLDLLTARQWLASGYQSKAAFLDYWAQAMPDAPASSAPWCWLIQFDFKG